MAGPRRPLSRGHYDAQLTCLEAGLDEGLDGALEGVDWQNATSPSAPGRASKASHVCVCTLRGCAGTRALLTPNHHLCLLQVRVVRLEGDTLEFDLIGVDASFATALRRVLIAEVPTMAIEQVYIGDNTSVIPDEVLSHRLGLGEYKQLAAFVLTANSSDARPTPAACYVPLLVWPY